MGSLAILAGAGAAMVLSVAVAVAAGWLCLRGLFRLLG